MSSYETAVERVKDVAAKLAPQMLIKVQPPYGDSPDYIAALTASAANYLEAGYDHLLFSFHGVPERHLKKSDPTRRHCLAVPNCCEGASPAHATCYRAQCLKTVAAFVKQAGVPAGKFSVSFQSRLGSDPWLKPYTDFELAELPKAGRQKSPGHLPGICFGLPGNAGGNRHSRAGNVFFGRRKGIHANPVFERAPALDCRAGENGRTLLNARARPETGAYLLVFPRPAGILNLSLTVSCKKPSKPFFFFGLRRSESARICGCIAGRETAARLP